MFISKTTDGGSSWNETRELCYIGDICKIGEKVFAVYHSKLEKQPRLTKSVDEGITWEEFRIDKRSARPNAVAVDPHNTDHIYVGAYSLGDIQEEYIYKTTDGGETWTRLRIHRGKNIFISKILFHPSGEKGKNRLFFSSQFGVYESEDEGISWRAVFKGSCNSFLISENDVFYVLKNKSVLASEDNGKTWHTIFETEKNQAFHDFHLDDRNNILLIAGYLGLISIDLNSLK
ncbi:WD40/YVTN/BNR-like repeat-containing protein [candidate division KSB1 bacterium]